MFDITRRMAATTWNRTRQALTGMFRATPPRAQQQNSAHASPSPRPLASPPLSMRPAAVPIATPAPVPVAVRPSPPTRAQAAPPLAAAISPRLRAMRRSAAFDLFRETALGPPPRAVWPFVDGTNDVGSGVARFLDRIGHRAAGIDGPLLELQRAETRLSELSAGRADALRRELLSGDPARFRDAVRSIGTKTTLSWPWPFPAPDAVSPVLGEAIEVAREHQRLRDALAEHWPPSWLGDPRSELLCGLLIAYEEAEVALAGNLASGSAAARVFLDTVAPIQRALADLEQAAAAAGSASAPADNGVGADRALAEIAAAENRAVAIRSWAALRWRYHPDRPKLTDAERARAQRIAGMADQALDRAERSASGRVGTTP